MGSFFWQIVKNYYTHTLIDLCTTQLSCTDIPIIDRAMCIYVWWYHVTMVTMRYLKQDFLSRELTWVENGFWLFVQKGLPF